jgi:hypothetical protein
MNYKNQYMSFRYLVVLLCVFCISCTETKSPTAQEIVDQAIITAGGSVIADASVHFKFRDYYYKATRSGGERRLERCTDANCQVQQDVLESDGEFVRFRESAPVPLADSMKQRYGNSVNSVHYFSVLPYGLNDAAVSKSLIGETIVKGEPYYQIKVHFAEDGGGEDFEDEYLYWIHKDRYTVDYLAYNYRVNEGGTRFREAYNERFVNGIRFVDYNNYKANEKFPPLATLDSLYENKKLELLSKIELEQVAVTQCPEC